MDSAQRVWSTPHLRREIAKWIIPENGMDNCTVAVYRNDFELVETNPYLKWHGMEHAVAFAAGHFELYEKLLRTVPYGYRNLPEVDYNFNDNRLFTVFRDTRLFTIDKESKEVYPTRVLVALFYLCAHTLPREKLYGRTFGSDYNGIIMNPLLNEKLCMRRRSGKTTAITLYAIRKAQFNYFRGEEKKVVHILTFNDNSQSTLIRKMKDLENARPLGLISISAFRERPKLDQLVAPDGELIVEGGQYMQPEVDISLCKAPVFSLNCSSEDNFIVMKTLVGF